MELVIDLGKGFGVNHGPLNKGKLVKRQVVVKRSNGKTFTRMQWVDPSDKNPNIIQPKTQEGDQSTYAHHEDGIKEMEKRQSNKFPVVHHDTGSLQNNGQYKKSDVDKAKEAYHNGEKLPPVKINGHGEVVENHHLVEMAKQLGLSHVPSVVVGETNSKKALEESLKEQTMVHDDDTGQAQIAAVANPSNRVNVTTDYVAGVEHFKNVTSKRYTKTHIMAEARRQGIKWNEYLKSGEKMEDHNQIMWMRAYQAITEHIGKGNTLEINHIEKDVDRRMEQDGWDSVQKHFIKLLDKFGGKKQKLMEWAEQNNIQWKRNTKHPNIDWMNCASEIKKRLAKGEMVGGVRTRQKAVMEEANLVITPQVREMVKALQKKYSKAAVMSRAKELGILWDEKDKQGDLIQGIKADNIQWMRASTAIQKYIARGNAFTMSDNEDPTNGMTARIGDYGEDVKMTKYQKLALDLAKRNSQEYEPKVKSWAMKALLSDNPDIDFDERNVLYDKFLQNARSAKLMIHFDPFETLKSGTMMIDQLSSDGMLKNNWDYNRVEDPEAMEINERELFGVDYDEAGKGERPVYGLVDLFNNGLDNFPLGTMAFVLNDEAKKRTSSAHTVSENLPYETNGKVTRSVEDPHHLIADRWMQRWGSPKNYDGKRKQYMDAIIKGDKLKVDEPFETHTHGGVDLRKDVDHLLVDYNIHDYDELHDRVKDFAKLMNIPIKYHGGDIV